MHKTLKLKSWLLLLMMIVGVGNAWADSYTITFKTGSGDGTSASTSTACSTIVSAGSSYLSGNLVTATKVYYGGGSGLKLGTSSASGTIKMTLAKNVKPTSIVVNAKRYNSSTSVTIKPNGTTGQTVSSASFADYTFNFDGKTEYSYIQLEATKYCWISSVTIYYESKTAAGLAYDVSSYTDILPGASFDMPTLTNPYGLTVSYTSSNTSVATVNSSTGAVTIGETEGTTTITASSAETDTYAAGSASYTITVAKRTTTVTLSDDSWTTNILDGATKTLTATPKYSGEAIDGAAVTWTSSNTSVATVSSGGVVTPVAPGSATIMASYAGTTIYAASNSTCDVTVNKANTTLTLDETSVSQDLKDGRTFTLTPTVKAKKSDDSEVSVESPTVTWTSSDETVATVSGGVVTGLKAGTATITASYAGGDNYNAASNATCSVTLTDTRTAVNMSTFTAAKTTLVIGDEQATSVTNDQAGWTAAYTYTSSNTSVATVDANGVITAVAKGTATITATLNISLSETGYKAGSTTSKTLSITVTKPFHTVTFYVNGNTDLTASVEEDQKITFPTAVETTPGENEFAKEINGQTFQGWYTGEYSNASVAPSYVNTSSTNMSTGDVTYYAVYATVEDVESDNLSDAVKSQTLQYDTWSYSGSTTDKSKNSYRLFHSGSYIESASFDLSKLIKVVVYGGTFGGTSYNSLTIGDGTSTWKNVTVSGSSETGLNTYTGGTALSGTNKLRIICNSGTASSTGVRISKVEIYVKGTVETKSNFTTDNRSAAGIAYTNDEVDVKLTSGYTGQALTNPNSLTVAYSSSDETVATVNSSTGAITELLKAGSTTITATFAGNATYKPAEVSYDLNVTEKTPHGLAYATDAVAKLTTDAAFTNTLTNGNSLTVSYSSSATSVAIVNSSTGEVTIKGTGSATITATFAGDEDYEAGSASYTLTVSKANPTLDFASANATGREGKAFAGNALTNPAGLTVSYSSSDTDVATVNSSTGAITIVAAGTTTITASFAGNDTYNEANASYTLKVLAAPTIGVSDEEIAWGETFTIDDSSITGGAITVTSGNTSVATVSGLVITPVACGKVVITVSTAEDETFDEGSQTFELTINQPAGGTEARADGSILLFGESFGNNTGSARDWSYSYSVKSGISDVYSGITGYTVSNVKQTKNTAGSTKSGLNQSTSGTDAYIIIGPLDVAAYRNLTLKYQWKAASIKGTYSTSAYYATSSSGEYTSISGTGDGATDFVERSYSLPAAAQVSTLYLKIVWNTSNTQAVIDEVQLKGSLPPIEVKLNASGYATFCSEYPLDFTDAENDGYSAWNLTDIDEDNTLTFTKITGKIKGGQGILLKGDDGETLTIPSADSDNELTTTKLVGITAPTYVASDLYYGLKGTSFVKVNAGVVKAGKALIEASDITEDPGAKPFTFVFDDTTTGIRTVEQVSAEEMESIFDLTGRRLARTQKGINIVNGKKVFIK